MKPTARLRSFLCTASSTLLAISHAHAIGGNWADNTGNFNWSDATKWSSNPTVPGTAAGDIINFTNNISAARTITVNTTSRTMGTLNIGDSDNTHGFTLASSGGGTLIIDNSGSGASINETGALGDIISAPIVLNDNLAVSAAGSLTLGAISQTGGARSITKTGAGALVLDGAGTYSGGFNLNVGQVQIGGNSISGGISSAFGTGKLTIASGTTINFLASAQLNNAVDMGGTVNLTRGVTGTKTWTQGSAGAVTLTANTTLNSTNAAFIFVGNSVIGETGGARSLTLSGNTMTATLNAANTYSGGTNNGAQTLNINNSGSGGTSSAIGTGTLTIGGGTINNTSAGLVTLSTNNVVALNGNFTFTGTQSLDLGTGNVSLSGTRAITVTANTLTLGGTIAAGAQGFTKLGAGTLALGGVNNTTGANTLTAGVLRLNHASALVGTTGNINLNGGLLGLGAADESFTGAGTGAGQVQWTASSGFTAYGANRTVTIGTAGTSINWTATNFIGAGNSLLLSSADSDATMIFNKEISLAGGGRTINVANGSAGIDAKLPQQLTGGAGGNSPFTKAGLGTLSLTAQSTYDGVTNITGGTLMLGDGTGNTGGLSSNSSSVVVSTGATLTVNRTGAVSQGASSALGDSAVISGQGGFTQAGSGTTTLTLTNTYQGATNVDAGKLIVNGNISTSSLTTVAVGATLGGTGTVGKAVINGTFAPGLSPGQMNFTDTLGLNGTTVMEIDGIAGAGVANGHDFVNLTGAGAAGVLTYGGTMTLDMGVIFGSGTYSWNLFDMASETGTFATITLSDQYSGSLLDGDLNGVWDLTSGSNTWQFTESTGVLGLTVVPEPNVAALFGGLGVLALLRRRRG